MWRYVWPTATRRADRGSRREALRWNTQRQDVVSSWEELRRVRRTIIINFLPQHKWQNVWVLKYGTCRNWNDGWERIEREERRERIVVLLLSFMTWPDISHLLRMSFEGISQGIARFLRCTFVFDVRARSARIYNHIPWMLTNNTAIVHSFHCALDR